MYEIIRYYRQIESQTMVPATGLDAATTAWIAAVIANGGTVSSPRRTLVDNLITGLKSDGVWTKLDRLWILAAENTPSALTDMVADSLATAVGGPPFAADLGYTGNDAVSPVYWIDTNFNASTAGGHYTQNAAHLSGWNVGNAASGAGGAILGQSAAASESDIYATFTDGNIYARINDSPGSGSQGAPGTRAGHWLLNRSGAAASQIYQNASLFSSPNQTSGSLVNLNTYILALNVAASGANGCPNQIAMASIGGSLSGTDATNFYTRLRTYMTAVGVP